jgi:uncharacterized coiled-coil protein SlyX
MMELGDLWLEIDRQRDAVNLLTSRVRDLEDRVARVDELERRVATLELDVGRLVRQARELAP